jgi:hypothetical protein
MYGVLLTPVALVLASLAYRLLSGEALALGDLRRPLAYVGTPLHDAWMADQDLSLLLFLVLAMLAWPGLGLLRRRRLAPGRRAHRLGSPEPPAEALASRPPLQGLLGRACGLALGVLGPLAWPSRRLRSAAPGLVRDDPDGARARRGGLARARRGRRREPRARRRLPRDAHDRGGGQRRVRRGLPRLRLRRRRPARLLRIRALFLAGSCSASSGAACAASPSSSVRWSSMRGRHAASSATPTRSARWGRAARPRRSPTCSRASSWRRSRAASWRSGSPTR